MQLYNPPGYRPIDCTCKQKKATVQCLKQSLDARLCTKPHTLCVWI